MFFLIRHSPGISKRCQTFINSGKGLANINTTTKRTKLFKQEVFLAWLLLFFFVHNSKHISLKGFLVAVYIHEHVSISSTFLLIWGNINQCTLTPQAIFLTLHRTFIFIEIKRAAGLKVFETPFSCLLICKVFFFSFKDKGEWKKEYKSIETLHLTHFFAFVYWFLWTYCNQQHISSG